MVRGRIREVAADLINKTTQYPFYFDRAGARVEGSDTFRRQQSVHLLPASE
jgi:hypothetical protein